MSGRSGYKVCFAGKENKTSLKYKWPESEGANGNQTGSLSQIRNILHSFLVSANTTIKSI